MLTDLSALATIKSSRTRRISSADPEGRNRDWIDVAPHSTFVVADIVGAGVINHLWFTLECPEDKWYLRKTLLRMYWDGESDPSVDTVFGDFFGVGHSKVRQFVTPFMDIIDSGKDRAGFNCYFPMPFGTSARIELANQSDSPMRLFFYVDYESLNAIGSDQASFHAKWRREYTTDLTRDYRILEASGRGHYVGTVFSVDTLSPGWFGEGNDKFYIDGDTAPTIQGTGTEDYFGHAWGFSREYNAPYHGTSLIDGSRYTVYRFHAPDPVRFERSLVVDIENWGYPEKDRVDDYASVAYWYQAEPHMPWSPMPDVEGRIPRPQSIPNEAIEAEALVPTALAIGGTVLVRKLEETHSQLVFKPEGQGSSVTLYIPIAEAGTYNICGYFAKGADHGMWQLTIDETPVPTLFDGYANGDKVTRVGPVPLSTANLMPGTHRFVFTVAGKNEQSRGYVIGIDALQIKPCGQE